MREIWIAEAGDTYKKGKQLVVSAVAVPGWRKFVCAEWARDEIKKAREKPPLEAAEDVGLRCPECGVIGHISGSAGGGGPWYCREHAP